MATERDLISLLRRHDERLAATPTRFALDLRVQRALRQARKGRRTAFRYVAMGGALLAAVAVLLLLRMKPASTLDGDAVHGQPPAAPCSIRGTASNTRYLGQCRVDSPAVSIHTQDGAELSRTESLWSVERGRCRFIVTPRTGAEPPLRVQVSGGVIEVTGTEFLVDQGETSGKVDLFEGTIRFLAPGRAPIEMHAGESFAWISSAAPEASASSVATEALITREAPPGDATRIRKDSSGERSVAGAIPEASTSSGQLERETGQNTAAQRDVLDRLQRLRSSGRYDEALRALPELNSDSLDDDDREVLSYEQGTLLERSGRNDAACKHWAVHARAYPRGSYRELVNARLSRCASASPGPSR